MKTLLIDGLGEAWRGLGGSFKLFWPVLACFAVMYFVGFLLGYYVMLESQAALIAFFFTGICAMLYFFFLLCQGAVGWHRRILLNEVPAWASLIPRRRAFQYALAVFLFGLLFLIAQMAVAYFVLPYLQSFMAPLLWDANAGNPTQDQLEALWKAMIPVQVIAFIGGVFLVSAVLWLTRSWLLVFPHVSIRTVEPTYGQFRGRLSIPTGLVGALLVAYFLPSALYLIYTVIAPMSMFLNPWIVFLSAIVNIAISAFCFLWGLSILSIAYRDVGVDKIPYEKISDGAQA